MQTLHSILSSSQHDRHTASPFSSTLTTVILANFLPPQPQLISDFSHRCSTGLCCRTFRRPVGLAGGRGGRGVRLSLAGAGLRRVLVASGFG
jgi:hypothetical protein